MLRCFDLTRPFLFSKTVELIKHISSYPFFAQMTPNSQHHMSRTFCHRVGEAECDTDSQTLWRCIGLEYVSVVYIACVFHNSIIYTYKSGRLRPEVAN